MSDMSYAIVLIFPTDPRSRDARHHNAIGTLEWTLVDSVLAALPALL